MGKDSFFKCCDQINLCRALTDECQSESRMKVEPGARMHIGLRFRVRSCFRENKVFSWRFRGVFVSRVVKKSSHVRPSLVLSRKLQVFS
jgi:hypothetical protein